MHVQSDHVPIIRLFLDISFQTLSPRDWLSKLVRSLYLISRSHFRPSETFLSFDEIEQRDGDYRTRVEERRREKEGGAWMKRSRFSRDNATKREPSNFGRFATSTSFAGPLHYLCIIFMNYFRLFSIHANN